MSIEVLAHGVGCNIDCGYCYQKKQRSLPRNKVVYDEAKLLARLQDLTEPWILFGGEPLQAKFAEVETLLRVGFETTGSSSIQTNGSLITPRHVEMFAKYNTCIGMSLDGPEELNDARWAGTLDMTRKMTRQSHAAIDLLVAKAKETGNARLIPSFIVQLHRLNISDDRWPKLLAWFRHLDDIGVAYAQYHMLDLDYEAKELYVEPELLSRRLLELWSVQQGFRQLRFNEMKEYVSAQRGQETHTCVWHACDPWNTAAVEGVNGDGTPTQCGRAGSNDGIDWVPAEGQGVASISRSSGFEGNRFHERQLSLYVTPQEHGGCQGCRFWLLCQGHCPGSAPPSVKDSEGDWRLRTGYCAVFKTVFEEAERRVVAIGETPTSLRPDRLALEALVYSRWSAGGELSLTNAIAELNGPRRTSGGCTSSGDGHGDSPHGDAHGDHIDKGLM